MKHFILLISVITLLLCNTTKGQNSNISIEFFSNGKQVELADDFEIFFVIIDSNQKHIIKPVIKENSFEAPDFCKYDKGHIVFKHRDRVIALGVNHLHYEQNMRWKIGLDKKPYSQEYHISQANAKETKGIVYIAFNPLEEGEGTVTTVSIVDFKKFFRESKLLIK